MAKGIVSNRGGKVIVAGGTNVVEAEVTGQSGATITFGDTYTFGATGVQFYRNGILMDKVGAFSGGSNNAEEYQEVNNGASSNQITLNPTDPATTDELFQMRFFEGTVTVGGGGTGVGDADTLFVDNADDSDLVDFTVDGVTISSSNPINGTDSFLISHDASVTKYLQKQFTVPPKFRGKNLSLIIDCNSDATQGNVVATVRDVTNGVDLVSSEQLALVNDVNASLKTLITFDCPADCSTMYYKIDGLAETGALTRVDDITLQLTKSASLETIAVEQEENTFSARIGNPTGSPFVISQSSAFIDSVSIISAGNVQINFIPGFFTETPAITASPADVGGNVFTSVANESSTGVTVHMDTDNSGGSNQDFNITVQRQGTDYRNLERRIEKEVSTFNEVLVSEADSYLDLGLATGSAGSQTLTFGTINNNIGDAFDYNASTGVTTVLKDGIYHANIMDEAAATDAEVSVRVNGSSVNLQTIHQGNLRHSIGWSGYLTAGDEISFHNSNTRGTGGSRRGFIAYQGSTKISQVSPESKITIPTSELKMGGTSSNGTGGEANTVVFDNILKLSGDAITVNNSNGSIFTIQKDGILSISSSFRTNTPGSYSYILRNSTSISEESVLAADLTSSASTFNVANLAWTGSVKAGDVIRIYNETTPGTDTTSTITLSHQEKDISVAVSNITPQFEDVDSMIRVHGAGSGAAGYGSTNTAIRRFTSIQETLGDEIEYIDSAVNGAEFIIKTSGFYAMSLTQSSDLVAAENYGISKNSTELATRILDINVNDRLAHSAIPGNGEDINVSWQGVLSKGDVIRVHGPVADDITIRNDRTYFTIAKVGLPSIAEVDVTPFVNVDRVERQAIEIDRQGSSLATTTGTLRFNGLDKNVGDPILRYTESNGRFTALKDCYITSSLILRASGAGNISIVVNGVTKSQGNINTQHDTVTHSTKLNKGDYLTFDTSGTLDGAERQYATIIAEADSKSRIYSIEQTENEFSARITNNGAASLASQSQNFIQGVERVGLGVVRVDFVPGFFTEVPSVMATIDDSSAVSTSRVQNTTVNNTFIVTQNTNDTPGALDLNFSIQVSRQGADRKDLQKSLVNLSAFPRVNRTLKQEIHHSGTSTNMGSVTLAGTGLDGTNLFTFDSSLSNSGDTILVQDFISGSNGTKFVAQKDCSVHGFFTMFNNGAALAAVDALKVDTDSTTIITRARGTTTQNDTSLVNCAFNFKLRKGQEVHLGYSSGVQSFAGLNIIAEAQELERVTNVDAHENVFSAKISNNGTASIISQSSDFIDSINRTSVGRITVNLKPGFFTEIPSIMVAARAASNANAETRNHTANSFEVATFVADTATDSDQDFELTLQRQGTDYKSIQDIVASIPDAIVKYDSTNTSSPGSTTEQVYTDTGLSLELEPGRWEITARLPIYITGNTGSGGNGRFGVIKLTDSLNADVLDINGVATKAPGPFATNTSSEVTTIVLDTIIDVTETETYKLRYTTYENSSPTTITSLGMYVSSPYGSASMKAVKRV